MRYAHCNDDAQEMLQEGFIRIYEKRDLYDEERSFAAWVKRIMINSSINYLRKNKRMMFVDDDTVFESSEENEFEMEVTSSTSEKIKIAIQNLSTGYRTVFNMFVMDNLTHNEIAEFLNISVNTSKSQLRKSRILLKEALEKEGITQYAEIDE
jgi:RNA polymerase sigma-70 factor (ECF subfamily)